MFACFFSCETSGILLCFLFFFVFSRFFDFCIFFLCETSGILFVFCFFCFPVFF